MRTTGILRISAIGFALGLLLLTPAARAVTSEDFEGPFRWTVYDGTNRGFSISQSTAPVAHGNSLKLNWASSHNSYAEVFTTSRSVVVDSEFNSTISFDVFGAQPAAVNRITLRLLDARNEVFQFQQPVTLFPGEWRTLTYHIRPGEFPTTYALDGTAVADKKVDLPLRLFAVTVDLEAGNAGSIYVDDFRANTAGPKTGVTRTYGKFDPVRETWFLQGVSGSVASLEAAAPATVLKCASSASDAGFTLNEKYFNIRNVGNPTNVSLFTEWLAGENIDLKLRLRDAKGELFQFKAKTPPADAGRVTWSMSADLESNWGDGADGVMDSPVQISQILVTRRASALVARLRLSALETYENLPELQGIDAEVETSSPIHVLRAGDAIAPALRLRNNADKPLSFALSGWMEDYDGRQIPFTAPVALNAGADTSISLPSPNRQGIWRVRYTLSNGAAQWDGQVPFVAMEPAGPTPGLAQGFLFSICTHSERWGLYDQDLEAMALALCGAKVARVGVEWGGIQPNENQWQWGGQDHVVDVYARQNVEVEQLLAYTPKWAAPVDKQNSANWLDWARAAPRLDAWRAYVAAITQRYNGRIRYWEVWNEPDWEFWKGTLPEYRALLTAASEEIRKTNPANRVLTGGFASTTFNLSFLQDVAVNAQADYDILAMHIHGSFSSFRSQVDGALASVRGQLNPAKPLYFNETAVASNYDDERMQAETLVKKLSFAWARGAMGYTWYDLRNDGYDKTSTEDNYGLVTNDYHPKAAYPAFNTLARMLGGKQYVNALDAGSSRYCFTFGDARGQVLVAWNENAGAADEIVRIVTDATRIRAYDIMGNQTSESAVVSRQGAFPLLATPQLIVLEGATRPPRIDDGSPTTGVREAWVYDRPRAGLPQ